MPRRKQNRKLKYSGKPYINADGVPMLGRSLRPPCNETCRQKCWQKITESQRKRIFDEYYNLADLHQQWQYLGRHMDKTVPKKRSRFRDRGAVMIDSHKTRGNNVNFYLQTDTDRLKVCKKMFLATFDIRQGVAYTVAQKTDEDGFLIQRDGRGGHLKRRFKTDNDHQPQPKDFSTSSGIIDNGNYYCTTSAS